ncbi:MAG: acyl--CoA ligase [Firmicutes bacterium]|nr:acyl--CoA ligase [Alicyclobacillaceae bacterium]MCL6496336.1 acyl--CoA ligase [Bacillota bacterium]
MLTLGEALEASVRRRSDKVALVFGERRWTYAEFWHRTGCWAEALARQGIRPQDRVALLLPNGLEMAEAYFGLARAGVVGVPINLRWAPPEIGYVLQHAEVQAVIADAQLAPLLAEVPGAPGRRFFTGRGAQPAWEAELAQVAGEPEPVAVRPETPSVIVYTSGTTGRPKGAVRSHFSNLVIAMSLAAELGIHHGDVGLALLPMFHVNSMWFVTLSLVIGATTVIYPHRTITPAAVVEALNRHRVTYSMFVPSLLTYLVDAAERGQLQPDSLRVMMTASAPLGPSLTARLLAAFPRLTLVDIYGATEYGAVTFMEYRQGEASPSGSVGFPALGQRVRILDAQHQPVPPGTIGEIWVQGPSLMTEYFQDPERTRTAFDAEGFLTVGDLGYLDAQGRLYLVDRKEDMAIVAGENVFPAEVEEVFHSHPAVALAVVFGVPDPRRGERLVAEVVLRPGATTTPEALRSWVAERLADYKRPWRIHVVPELPIGPSGKVLRRLARERYLAQMAEG